MMDLVAIPSYVFIPRVPAGALDIFLSSNQPNPQFNLQLESNWVTRFAPPKFISNSSEHKELGVGRTLLSYNQPPSQSLSPNRPIVLCPIPTSTRVSRSIYFVQKI